MQRNTRYVLCFLLLLAFTFPLFSQSAPLKYAMVEIKVAYKDLAQLHQLGLPLDCSYCVPSDSECVYTVPLTEYDLNLLKEHRFAYRIVIENVAQFYAVRNTKEELAKAEAYRRTLDVDIELGSMGGFYTLEEANHKLDQLYESYKQQNLIAAKEIIGYSYENRPIYAIKISDNADVDESDSEPQALYTALTHAREPGGMMAIFYFMHYLLQNYDKSERVRNIVENRELYFIPVVNPDGYAYNQETNPNGGGMLRKNTNGNGIDLNRNFGPQELWDYPNGGSSTSSWSQTYRGTAAFSEKETQAYRDFVISKKFRTAINYHTYSNLLIHPWGYKNECPEAFFKTMAENMTKINGYRYGTAPGLLYAVRGDSDDWLYKEMGIFALTPEVGGYSDGFWPSASRILPLCEENLDANLLLAEYAGQIMLPKKKQK